MQMKVVIMNCVKCGHPWFSHEYAFGRFYVYDSINVIGILFLSNCSSFDLFPVVFQ